MKNVDITKRTLFGAVSISKMKPPQAEAAPWNRWHFSIARPVNKVTPWRVACGRRRHFCHCHLQIFPISVSVEV
jgi:hypothetical protein